MNFAAYSAYFEHILHTPIDSQKAPYNNADYLDYTKLNFSRMNRWFKKGELAIDLLQTVAAIDAPQQWIVITEPWCGDAAHNVPFIEMVAATTPLITVSYVLRDTPPFLIEEYLTNGTKSIPKLIIRDGQGKDLVTWGPRPANCQLMYAALLKKQADFDTVKVEIQNWYNGNKGVELQQELRELILNA